MLVSLGLMAATQGQGLCTEFPVEAQGSVAGQIGGYVTTVGDTLLDVARKFDLGYTQLAAANPQINPWLPGAGKTVIIPTRYILPDVPHRGIVINLAAQRLYYFRGDGRRVDTYPIGVGVIGRTTPLGITVVTHKEPNPVWIPTASILAAEPDLPPRIAAGPENPLGAFALHLAWPDYLIHGTNKPYGVGRDVSHGCIRLYPEDIAELFKRVAVGTRVQVVRQEVAAAWIDNKLVVEVYPNKSQADEIDITGHFTPELPQDLIARITTLRDQRGGLVDWSAVQKAGIERTGLPVEVGESPKDG